MRIDDLFSADKDAFAEGLQKQFPEMLINSTLPDQNNPQMGLLNSIGQGMTPENNFISEFLEEKVGFNHQVNEKYVKFFSDILSAYGIFCVSSVPSNILMWSHYAEEHTGVVFEITPTINSMFQCLQPVRYSRERPMLYKTAEEFLAAYNTEPTKLAEAMLNLYTYTKSKDWEYENEYRLAMPEYVYEGEKHCDIKFDVKDLTGIYLGCRLGDEEQKKVTSLARSINSQITVKRAVASKHEYVLQFEDI